MAKETTTQFIRGKAMWAKITGAPRTNTFDPDTKEWTIDVYPDGDGIKLLKKLGLQKKIKDRGQGEYIQFRQKELRQDGTVNEPIRIVDVDGSDWDGRNIGNGTDVDVKFVVRDYGVGKQKGVYIRAVRVLKLVPYERQEFTPLSEDDKFFAEPQKGQDELHIKDFDKKFMGKDEDLDDDIAF